MLLDGSYASEGEASTYRISPIWNFGVGTTDQKAHHPTFIGAYCRSSQTQNTLPPDDNNNDDN